VAVFERVKDLAAKHRVGFFDVGSDEEGIWLATARGGLEKMKK